METKIEARHVVDDRDLSWLVLTTEEVFHTPLVEIRLEEGIDLQEAIGINFMDENFVWLEGLENGMTVLRVVHATNWDWDAWEKSTETAPEWFPIPPPAEAFESIEAFEKRNETTDQSFASGSHSSSFRAD